jgi:branched-chain amino acid transport system ATP-binding protein
MLEVKAISVFYDGLQALHEVSFEIERGDLVALVGSNGAGKTTLINVIVGLIKPKSGAIYFNGDRIDTLPTHLVVEKGISLAPEAKWIFPYMNVEENLLMGAFLAKDQNKNRERLSMVFSYFPILSERRRQLASTLSGGELQMLVIARSLMPDPDMVILDEPSLGLAPRLVKNVFEVISTLHAEKALTIIIAEQNIHEALNIASWGLVLENGRVVMKGHSKDLLLNQEIKKKYLGI